MIIEHEEWRPVEIENGKYRDLYAISNIGRLIRYNESNKRDIAYLDPNYQDGYQRVQLYKNNEGERYFIHTLVADAFIRKNNDNNLIINHKDRQRWNCRVNNLEYVSRKENGEHWSNWKGSNSWKEKEKDEYIIWLNKKQNPNIMDNINLTKNERMTQKWLPIKDYPDYAISDKGLVLSFKNNKFNYLSMHTSLKYYSVLLYNKNNKRGARKKVAKLVAETFIGEIPKGHEIHHIDTDTFNNRVENLKIVSQEQHWIEHGFASDNTILEAMKLVEKGFCKKYIINKLKIPSTNTLNKYLKGNKRSYLHKSRIKDLNITTNEYYKLCGLRAL
ncbi:MAG: HNH endonuclease [Nitrososphaeraceae archaeon]